MASDPVLKYSHHAIVVHPLRNPEIPERAPALLGKDNASARYLRARSGGFLLVRWLKNDPVEHPDVSVGLFASVDRPQELVIIKKLKRLLRHDHAADVSNPMAAEIELSTVADPLVRRQLPLYHPKMGQTPFPQLDAVQVHHRGTRGKAYGDFDATLFYKYYNGGTLYDLMEKYRLANRMVPEGFIWHYVAEHGRALAWLHTGDIPSREYNVAHKAEIGQPGKAVNRWRPALAWDALCHMDAHADNIWLHYPTEEEKAANPELRRFGDARPQIILGDFGIAMQARNDRNNLLQARTSPDMPEPETLRDKSDLGSNLLRLAVAGMPAPARHKIMDAVRTGARTGSSRRPKKPAPESDVDVCMSKSYSPGLLACYKRLRPLVELVESNDWDELLRRTDRADWARFPSNDFVYGTMIAMADAYLDGYVGSSAEESVRWTQPLPTCMPLRALVRRPRHHRWDWDKVDEQLSWHIRKAFFQYGPGSVAICQAHVIGAGVPEAELEQVEFDESYGLELRDERAQEAEAIAGRATVVPPREASPEFRIRSPATTPPEYRRRREIDDAVYQQRRRLRLRPRRS
ncbi:uncharacterized protein THITE_2126151 [Thermothielavioides terrestris NRRL 8126]|uniref:Protein kinase domain-containing protein n=1 Tax=Thermothielavioides terrestris (strain ATCC 38088 / NRRL 8126) TaxID=578455 RepID=G2QUC9_THETT|nr:uncharacterized protein THITE_2126151 [Thermothielavioides terrestris NRRL 8126]AEO63681.1 hypothetical protein THITE_2126151 [Thermothielavioides terrestris NRRL 8126]